MIIQPISEAKQQQVRFATHAFLKKAREIYKVDISIIPVSFDLKGRAAGMYLIKNNQRSIRYNPYLFAKYFDDNLTATVPHEVAHYVTDALYGLSGIKPHGAEWCRVMQDFGAEPQVTARYDLTGIPVRKHRRYEYQCGCNTHSISAARHNKVTKGRARYHCRHCGTVINFVE